MLDVAQMRIVEHVRAGLRSGEMPFVVVYGPTASGKSELLRSIPNLVSGLGLVSRAPCFHVDCERVDWVTPGEPTNQLGAEIARAASELFGSTKSGTTALEEVLATLASQGRRRKCNCVIVVIDHLEYLPNEGIRNICDQLKLVREADRESLPANGKLSVILSSARNLGWLNDQGPSPFLGHESIVLPISHKTADECDSRLTSWLAQLVGENAQNTTAIASKLLAGRYHAKALRQPLFQMATSKSVASCVKDLLESPALAGLRGRSREFDEFEETGLLTADHEARRYRFRCPVVAEICERALHLIKEGGATTLPTNSLGAELSELGNWEREIRASAGLFESLQVIQRIWEITVDNRKPEFYFCVTGTNSGRLWVNYRDSGITLMAFDQAPSVCKEALQLSRRRRHSYIVANKTQAAFWQKIEWKDVLIVAVAVVKRGRLTIELNETVARSVANVIAGTQQYIGGQVIQEFGRLHVIGGANVGDNRNKLEKPSPRAVFVVHGRDIAAKAKVEGFLRKIDLRPVEWEEARSFAGSANAFTLDIVKAGLQHAQAVVVIMTGDDEARLRMQSDVNSGEAEPYTPQPRQNVLIEAGMALGINPKRTLLVQVGHIRPASDLSGLNYLMFDDSPAARQAFAHRLEDAGCQVNLKGSAWLDR